MENREQRVVVLVTVPDLETGEEIANRLLERKLAACVNISPGLISLYHWQGEIQRDSELLLLIKTRLSLVSGELIPAIRELHPYQLPEIIALPIIGGERGYLDWILQETLERRND
ncbi:MAG: divalent-cation tolerance protein CutA [Anaerolineales bacterium]